MNVALKLGFYGLGLTAAFGAALLTGSTIGPVLPDASADGNDDAQLPPAQDEEAEEAGEEVEATGMAIADGGYTLEPVTAPGEAGEEESLSFRITGPDGAAVTDFAVAHDKRMHLIAVGRDLSGYQHLHPEMAEDGTWSIPAEFDTPGPYRIFADFVPEERGEGIVLGADIAVPGDYEPAGLPESEAQAEVDGYEVELDGDLAPGESSELAFTVRHDGEPVTDLEPYLGAYGHLVALRAGDLAYLHVHPLGEPGDGASEPGPEVTFDAEVPSGGDYRLFLDFQHDGEVRTAEFTVSADGPAASPTASDDESPAEHGH